MSWNAKQVVTVLEHLVAKYFGPAVKQEIEELLAADSADSKDTSKETSTSGATGSASTSGKK